MIKNLFADVYVSTIGPGFFSDPRSQSLLCGPESSRGQTPSIQYERPDLTSVTDQGRQSGIRKKGAEIQFRRFEQGFQGFQFRAFQGQRGASLALSGQQKQRYQSHLSP
jgi:hypothetical protein